MNMVEAKPITSTVAAMVEGTMEREILIRNRCKFHPFILGSLFTCMFFLSGPGI